MKEGACSKDPYQKVNISISPPPSFSFLQEFGTLKETVLYLEIIPRATLKGKVTVMECLQHKLFSSILSLAVASLRTQSGKLSRHNKGARLNHCLLVKRQQIKKKKKKVIDNTAVGIVSSYLQLMRSPRNFSIVTQRGLPTHVFMQLPASLSSQPLIFGGKFGCQKRSTQKPYATDSATFLYNADYFLYKEIIDFSWAFL